MKRVKKLFQRKKESEKSTHSAVPPVQDPGQGSNGPSKASPLQVREHEIQQHPAVHETRNTAAVTQIQQDHSKNRNSVNTFQYKPLKRARNFRILHLKRRKDQPVDVVAYTALSLQGSIVETSIDNPQAYYALSYTWGDPEASETIEIDGKVLRITKNCAAALRRMLRGKQDRVIWVDSICINQSNDGSAVEERGGQVAMMDQIYRQAQQVLVFLGEGNAASDVACIALKALAQVYLSAKMGTGQAQAAARAEYERLAEDALKTTVEYPYGKLYGVFRLPWFRRAWVLQEVAVAKNVMFYCGQHLMHFWTMVVGADFTRLPYSKLDVEAKYWRAHLEYHHTMQELVRRKSEGEVIDFPFVSLIHLSAFILEATRPEDKIYSLYGVFKDLGFELSVPNYKKPLAVVYTEAARAMIRHEGNLDSLNNVEGSSGREFGLPSWVLNFSGCVRRWSPTEPPHMVIQTRTNKLVSGSSKVEFEFMPDGRGLKVKGRRFDSITAVGKTWEIDGSTNVLNNGFTPTGQYIGSLIESISSWYDIVKDPSTGNPGLEPLDLLIQVLTYGASGDSFSQDSVGLMRRCIPVLLSCTAAKDTVHMTRAMDPNDSPLDILQVGNYFVSPGMKRFFHMLQDLVWRTMFRTSRGSLAIGSYGAQPGDIVVVLHGSATPQILREHSGAYSLVGTGTVHGIMNGEFWDTYSSVNDEFFVLN